MGVLDGARDKLAGLWERVKAWARSVPPDVWIGLAIAAATLIVVYLAYRKSGSSSDGLSTTDPVIGQSDTPGTTPLTSQDVISPGAFDISQLWTRPTAGAPGKPGKAAGGLKETIDHIQGVFNQNELNGQNATIAAFSRSQAQQRAVITSATTRDESAIVRSIQKPLTPSPIITSATTRDESVVAKIIQAVKPQPKPAAAPIRPSPFAITPTPTGRGVNISF